MTLRHAFSSPPTLPSLPSMTDFPPGLHLSGMVEAMVSVRRVQAFLMQPELKSAWAYRDSPLYTMRGGANITSLPRGPPHAVEPRADKRHRRPDGGGLSEDARQPLLAPPGGTLVRRPVPGPLSGAAIAPAPAALPMYPECVALVSEVTCSWTAGQVRTSFSTLISTSKRQSKQDWDVYGFSK